MKTASLLLLATSGAAAAAAAAIRGSNEPHQRANLLARQTTGNNNTSTGNTTGTASSYLARMADTQMRRGVERAFDYTTAVLYRGVELAFAQSDNRSVIDWYEAQMSIVGDDGAIADYNYTFHSLDEYRFGMSLLYWYDRTGADKYKLAADRIRAMLDTHPRNEAGGFWHREPTYPDQMWLDGIYMADTFYATYTSLFQPDNSSAWDDVALQFALIEQHCRDNATLLLKHGYDESKVSSWADPATGASPLVWDRAVGWYFVSLAETIQVFETSHAGYEKLKGYFRTLAEGLLRAQDAEGGWWLVMDEQYVGAEGNYIESSATAMFTYGFLLGIRLGLIDEATYLAPAKKAYEMMVDKFVVEAGDGLLDWEGTVKVGSLSSNATFEYYTSVEVKENDYKGVGPFMWASYEYENL